MGTSRGLSSHFLPLAIASSLGNYNHRLLPLKSLKILKDGHLCIVMVLDAHLLLPLINLSMCGMVL